MVFFSQIWNKKGIHISIFVTYCSFSLWIKTILRHFYCNVEHFKNYFQLHHFKSYYSPLSVSYRYGKIYRPITIPIMDFLIGRYRYSPRYRYIGQYRYQWYISRTLRGNPPCVLHSHDIGKKLYVYYCVDSWKMLLAIKSHTKQLRFLPSGMVRILCIMDTIKHQSQVSPHTIMKSP